MSGAKMERLHLYPTQINGCTVGVNQPRQTLLIATKHIVPGILVRNDFGHFEKTCVTATVITMVVCIDDVPHRQRADAGDE